MKKLFIVLTVMAFFAGTASAKMLEAKPVYEVSPSDRGNAVVWFDDMEGDVSAYITQDLSAGAAPHFHWDTYLAFGGSGQSWWCGTFDYDADGGYGNSWDDRLDIPTTDVSAATYPVLTYAYRHDSEIGYDYTYVQAESLGVYVDLNRGYDGFQAWTDIGIYGFVLVPYDNPVNARFRFLSDGAWSDEDGLYLSNGGGFHCDNVKIFDYFGGAVYFYDSEPGIGVDENECVPSVPAAAGDYWHLIDRACPALSDPHSWWCGDDADTSLVPPMLQNALFAPVVDISGATACTAHFAMHFAIPTVDNDYMSMYAGINGGYYSLGGWWGDFGSCDGWGGTAYNTGFDCGQFTTDELMTASFAWVMYTTENGCGPGGGGDAGAMIDDLWYEVPTSPVEPVSWGSIKSLYR